MMGTSSYMYQATIAPTRGHPTLGAVKPIRRSDLGIFPGKFGQSAPPAPRPETPMSAAAQLHFPRW
ncbi:hypothetical protein CABS01_07051 [Colletotrichum abscissum]|uniref:uncharacterized protein n=1 Tax=Colletotrichum abscissum TaxID=1671311 RepID=UPI0027D5C4D1|nr:uncharacterized protein CABS01_07051 [Colletotrichum abscissum]KAK1513645.1 hypothetical protein CABS01_07051 [Colletotrichum abscissum]